MICALSVADSVRVVPDSVMIMPVISWLTLTFWVELLLTTGKTSTPVRGGVIAVSWEIFKSAMINLYLENA